MRKPFLALFALALLSGCGILFAEVEIPEICVTLKPTTYDGLYGVNLTTTIPIDLGSDISQLNDPNATVDLRLLSLSIAATNELQLPPSKLGGVNSITITVIDTSGHAPLLPDRTVAQYQKASPAATPNALAAVASDSVNLEPYLMNGKVEIQAAATMVPGGLLPATPWDASVTTCFYLKAKYDYGQRILDEIKKK